MIIEFLGPPRSGKTHQIKLLRKHYESLGKNVYIIEDRIIEKDVLVHVHDVWKYNVLFFNKVLEKLTYAQVVLKPDLIILDRGFYDAFAWFHAELLNNTLTKEQVDAAIKFYESFQKYIDKAILIDVDIPISMSRHKHTGISGITDDYIMNEKYLSCMKKAYVLLKKRYSSSKICIIDGNQDANTVHEEIKECLGL